MNIHGSRRAGPVSPGAPALRGAGRGRRHEGDAADLQPHLPVLADYKASPGAFEPLPLDRYVAWIRTYIEAGGRLTSYRDHPYPGPGEGFLLAVRDFATGGECGAAARAIVVPPGIRHLGGGLGHCSLYLEAGGPEGPPAECQGTPEVPAYSDPEFSGLRGYAELVTGYRVERDRRELTMRIEKENLARMSDLSAHIQAGSETYQNQEHDREAAERFNDLPARFPSPGGPPGPPGNIGARQAGRPPRGR